NVFGGDFDEAGADFGQTPREQTAEAEMACVVLGVVFLWFESEIECFGRGGTQEAIGVVDRAEQRLFLKIAAVLAGGALLDEFLVKFVPIFKARWAHAGRRANALDGLLGIRDDERTIFAAEKAAGMESFQFFAFPHVKALTNTDERRHCR